MSMIEEKLTGGVHGIGPAGNELGAEPSGGALRAEPMDDARTEGCAAPVPSDGKKLTGGGTLRRA